MNPHAFARHVRGARHGRRPAAGPGPRRTRGYTMMYVLLLLGTLSVIAGAMLSASRMDLGVARSHTRGIEAFYQAEAGVQYVLACLGRDVSNKTVTLTSTGTTVNYTAPSGYTFETVTGLTALAVSNRFRFQVTGRCGDSRATIETVLAYQPGSATHPFGPFDFDMFGNYTITLSGGSYGRGNVHGNDSAVFSDSSAFLIGNLTYYNKLTTHTATTIVGTVTKTNGWITMPPVPTADLAYASNNNNNASIPAGFRSGTELSVSGGGTLLLAPGVYIFSKVTFSGGSSLKVSGPTTIYCTGDYTVSGGSMHNDAKDPNLLRVYVTKTLAKVTISGTSANYCHFYAPEADSTTISGGGTYYGALVSGGRYPGNGKGKITFSGGSDYGGGGWRSGGGGGGGGSPDGGLSVASWRRVIN